MVAHARRRTDCPREALTGMRRPERLLLATKNRGKIRELLDLLAPLGVQLVEVATLEAERGPAPEVEETAETFIGNARLKAIGWARWAGLPVIADDSGLEVDALGGAPGVHSARYAGEHGDDAANNLKLLRDLAAVPEPERTARFRAAAVYYDPTDGYELVSEGRWEGRIGLAPAGEGGFGYDPLFVVPDAGCTSAELPAHEKHRRSHRGQAVRALVAKLAEQS